MYCLECLDYLIFNFCFNRCAAIEDNVIFTAKRRSSLATSV